MSDEKGNVKLLLHSIQHLIPIEASDEDMHISESTTHELNEPPPVDDTLIDFQDSTVSTRPQRKAAIEGQTVCRIWTSSNKDVAH